MPNWVYNNFSIEGEENSLIALERLLTKDSDFLKERRKMAGRGEWDKSFSFSNILSPPRDGWDDYFAVASFGEDGRPVPIENWYEWNNCNWGTKWDAVDTVVELQGGSLEISFNTAWSPIGDTLLSALSATLSEYGIETVSYFFEEEQGWGGEMFWQDGTWVTTDEWDIPNCHADYVARGREDSCMCQLYDDEDYRYDDCPKEEK